ncbi:hypothetical protein [Bacillus cereus]|uniref:hypothetical protein n=1 Tax=Bacillus cereus TaxID=1396 RepID=UPI0015CF3765|nr:hypothetical protein [Bacillus cereus]
MHAKRNGTSDIASTVFGSLPVRGKAWKPFLSTYRDEQPFRTIAYHPSAMILICIIW